MGATTEGLTELIDDLKRVEEVAPEEVAKVVKKGLQNIKTDTQARWAGARYAPSLAAAVTYDEPKIEGSTVSGEVGPDKDRRQGALGNIYEFGVPGTAPQPALNPAADVEEPRFAKALEDLGGDLLEGKVTR